MITNKDLEDDRHIDGRRLAERRLAIIVELPDGRKRPMTQGDLSKVSGVDKSTISRIERGVLRTSSMNTVMRLAAATKCSGYYLLGVRDDPGPTVIVNPRKLALLGYFDRLDDKGQLAQLENIKEAVDLFERLKPKTRLSNGCK